MVKAVRMLGVMAAVLSIGAAGAQVATGWTLPGLHAPIVRGGDGVIRMDAVSGYSPKGVHLWSKGIGNMTDLKAATDGKTYVCTSAGEVICLDSAGAQVWKYRNPALSEQFTSMRVLGNYLWVVGKRPVTVGATTRVGTSYAKFDRLTGAKLHSSGMILSTDTAINEGAVKLVGNASANFVLVGAQGPGGSLYLGLARMDLDTGSLVSSTFFLTGRVPTALAVDSQSQVYVVDGALRKFDGSATPAINELWVRNNANGTVFISKGSIFTISGSSIFKTLPNGDQTTIASYGFPEVLQHLVADPAGKLYAMVWAFNYVYPEPVVAYCKVLAYDPNTAQLLWTEMLNPNDEGSASLTTDAWGTVFASGGNKTVALYQYPEPQPDNYTLPGGRAFIAAAPGLMANDGYTDPYVCRTLKYTNPEHGYLSVRDDGSFTYTPKPGFIGQDSFQYEVVRGMFARYTTVSLKVEHSATLTLAKKEIAGQNAMLATIKLSNPIPSIAVVAVEDNSAQVTTPTFVTIPAGQTARAFGIQVKPVSSTVVTTITATYNGYAQSEMLTLVPLIPTALVLTPNTIVGGNSVSAKVVMNGVAGAGGRTFAVRSSSSSAQPPLTITVPAGQSSFEFAIPTTPVTQSVTATIRVAATAGEKTTVLTINP